MSLWNSIITSLAIATSVALPQELPPGVLLLSHIKAHMRWELAHLTNYTCVEVVQRYHKSAGRKGSMKPLDTIRLEVAYNAGRELYSWPGDRSFREDNPSAFIGSGAIGNGIFALHLRSLFVDDQATFTYRGEEDLGGRRVARYDFRLPWLMSGYIIQVVEVRRKVGMKGSVWADPHSLEPLRLEIHADDIPPDLPVVDAITIIDYARMRIGNTDVLLPQTGDLHMIETSGLESRDVIAFTHCRSFTSESKVSFNSETSPAQSAAPADPPLIAAHVPEAEETVPGGLLVSFILTTPLTEQTPVGQLLEGRVSGSVNYKNKVLIRDGAVVRGRVRRLERYSQPSDYFVVALEFSEIEAGASSIRLYADLQDVYRTPGIEWLLSDSSLYSRKLPGGGRVHISTTENIFVKELPGVGSFFIRGTHFTLPKGLRMTWKTRTLSR